MYQSAPVWHFGFAWVIFDRSKSAGLSGLGHFPQQGAGEQHETNPCLSLGTTTVISASHSELLRRGCHGPPVAGFPLSPGLILNK